MDGGPAPSLSLTPLQGREAVERDARSTTDADARLFRKRNGQASQLCFIGHALMENRNGLAVDAKLPRAAGSAERLAALAMAETLAAGHKTLGADRGYDTHDFIMELRELGVTHASRRTLMKPKPRANARRSMAAPPGMRATW